MSSLIHFSAFTEVYPHQFSNTKVRNLIYMKIKMIHNGKKNAKTWKTVALCRDLKLTIFPVSFKNGICVR